MKKTSAWLMVLVLAFAASRLSAEDYDPDRWYGHFSYLIGYKGIESEWAPADDQFMFAGFDLDAQPPGWPVSLTLQLLVSTTDDIPDHPRFLGDFTSTLELNLGVRKVWRQNAALQPFIGGGLSIISVATITDDGYWWSYEEDGDTGVGWWAGGGVYWKFAERFHVGVVAQYSWAEVDLFGRDFNGGGMMCAFMIGGNW